MKNCGLGGGELVHLSYGVSGLLTRNTYGICHENMGCCESLFLEHHKHGHWLIANMRMNLCRVNVIVLCVSLSAPFLLHHPGGPRMQRSNPLGVLLRIPFCSDSNPFFFWLVTTFSLLKEVLILYSWSMLKPSVCWKSIAIILNSYETPTFFSAFWGCPLSLWLKEKTSEALRVEPHPTRVDLLILFP